ncbi:MAG: hypothetical protein Q8L87_00645, partial [Anaerolineales bacterium]|nr:hypothetical protein [Anaerolineales bacterium]
MKIDYPQHLRLFTSFAVSSQKLGAETLKVSLAGQIILSNSVFCQQSTQSDRKTFRVWEFTPN